MIVVEVLNFLRIDSVSHEFVQHLPAIEELPHFHDAPVDGFREVLLSGVRSSGRSVDGGLAAPILVLAVSYLSWVGK